VEKEFVNPNLHVALVHYPLALLISGTLIELFSFLWRRHGFRAAGRWMILLGAFSGIPTALSGVYALSDVARMGLDPSTAGGTWKEVAAASSLSAAQWQMLRKHLLYQLWAVIVSVTAVVVWIACSDRWRERLHLPLLVLLLVGVVLTSAGAWHGGEAVYRYGTGVLGQAQAPTAPLAPPMQDQIQPPAQTQPVESPQPPTPEPAAPDAAPATAPTTTASASVAVESVNIWTAQASADVTGEGAAARAQRRLAEQVEYYLPPLQIHMVLAGTAIAIALASLGLSIRKITQGPPVTQVDAIAAALGPPPTLIGGDTPDTLVESAPPPPDPADRNLLPVPAARFWVLTALLGLLAAAAGAWALASAADNWSFAVLWKEIILANARAGERRQMAHVISGLVIVLEPLLLAMQTRWAPRQKWLLTVLALLLLGAVGFQIWLGTLLLFDTPQGRLTSFN